MSEEFERPPNLGKLIDTISDKYELGENKFAKFISLADRVSKSSLGETGLSIEISFKMTQVFRKEKDEQEEGPVEHRNSSLLDIFSFYCGMQQNFTTTFSAKELVGQTMSFFDVEKFCRDFRIIPKYLAKLDIKTLWNVRVQEGSFLGTHKSNRLDFEEFQDFFVRMAIFSYNKPGLKRLILAVNGFNPTPVEIVRYFCHFLHLENQMWVKNHIRTVGHQTEGALNYRSKDEHNVLAQEERKSDLRAKILAREVELEKKEKLAAQAPGSSSRRGKLDRESPQKNYRFQQSVGGWSEASVGAEDSNRSSDLPSLGIKTAYGSPSKKSSSRRNFISPASPAKKSLLPQHISDMLQDASGGAGNAGRSVSNSNSTIHGRSDGRNEDMGEEEKAVKDQLVGSDGGSRSPNQKSKHHHPHEKHMDSSDAPVTTAEANAAYAALVVSLEPLLSGYDVSLKRETAPYSYNSPGTEDNEVINSGGPYLDMGNLPSGSDCIVKLSFTNLSHDDMHVDVTAKGFHSHNTRVVTYPRSLIPGFTRCATVSFTVGFELRSVVGFITVHAISDRTGIQHEVNCPVFYRIDHALRPRNLCTSKTLHDYCSKFIGLNHCYHMSFERKLPSTISWMRPVSTPVSRQLGYQTIGELDMESSQSGSLESKERTPKTKNVRPMTAGYFRN